MDITSFFIWIYEKTPPLVISVGSFFVAIRFWVLFVEELRLVGRINKIFPALAWIFLAVLYVFVQWNPPWWVGGGRVMQRFVITMLIFSTMLDTFNLPIIVNKRYLRFLNGKQ